MEGCIFIVYRNGNRLSNHSYEDEDSAILACARLSMKHPENVYTYKIV